MLRGEVSLNLAWAQSFEQNKSNLDVTPLAAPIEFSGGVLTPFVALAHWVLGRGQQAKVNINNIGISPSVEKIPQLVAAFDSANIGTGRLDITFPYNTGMDSNISRIYLGSITLRVMGDVTKAADGSVSFTGTIRAYSDKYDANASSHRGGFDEVATSLLREVGRVANAQDYEILIEGELPLNL
ncbi:Colicin-M [compost metagenome]